MAHWRDVAVTRDGIKMLNEMMAGCHLRLTSAYGGTGVVDTAVLGEQTAMVDQKQKLALVDEQDGPEGKTVTVQISSAGNSEEYLLRQIGVYATLDVAGAEEKLLFLMQDEGVVIPAETEESLLLEIYCMLRIGADAQLMVTIDPSGIVTIQRMKDALGRCQALSGESDPTIATVGTVGQHYLNTLTLKEFVCVAAGEEGYVWQVAGANIADDLTCGGQPLTEVLGAVEPVEGAAAPTEQTAGIVGQKYTDTSTGTVYTCIAVSLGEDGGERYTWVPGRLGTLEEIRAALSTKAPLGLITDKIHCSTNDDIEAAIESLYGAMADETIQNFLLTIDEPGLILPGGKNFLTICRGNVNFGLVLAYTYSYDFVSARAMLHRTWKNWRHVAFTDDMSAAFEPLGLINGDVVGCGTQEEVEAAIDAHYAAAKNHSISHFAVALTAYTSVFPGGTWQVSIHKTTDDFGEIMVYGYGPNPVFSRARRSGKWESWRSVMFDDERYGLGEVIGPTCSDFLQLKYNGWYYIHNADNSPVFGGVEYKWGTALVIAARTNTQIEYWAHQPRAPCNQHFRRMWNETYGWQPWEVINPNMMVGAEYRTVERHHYKPVYIKMIDCGTMPNNAAKQVAIGTSNIDKILRCEAVMSSGEPLPYYNADTGARAEIQRVSPDNGGTIYLVTNKSFGEQTAYATVAYTKTTDPHDP